MLLYSMVMVMHSLSGYLYHICVWYCSLSLAPCCLSFVDTLAFTLSMLGEVQHKEVAV